MVPRCSTLSTDPPATSPASLLFAKQSSRCPAQREPERERERREGGQEGERRKKEGKGDQAGGGRRTVGGSVGWSVLRMERCCAESNTSLRIRRAPPYPAARRLASSLPCRGGLTRRLPPPPPTLHRSPLSPHSSTQLSTVSTEGERSEREDSTVLLISFGAPRPLWSSSTPSKASGCGQRRWDAVGEGGAEHRPA